MTDCKQRDVDGIPMPIEIEGQQFSGFPGRDSHGLMALSFQGRISWVEYRYRTFFLDTFDRVVALEQESYVWLCVVNLLTSAIEAFAHFEFEDKVGMVSFSKFVERYFGPAFRAPMTLDDCPNVHYNRPARTSAEHLYRYFRSGLAHSFCIEWGGLQHREEAGTPYLFETQLGRQGERALAIAPRELVQDFREAVERYFATLRARQPQEPEHIQFNQQFEIVYHNKMAPPLS
jgi:hypothetical protein